jgi:hypothetical protein
MVMEVYIYVRQLLQQKHSCLYEQPRIYIVNIIGTRPTEHA